MARTRTAMLTRTQRQGTITSASRVPDAVSTDFEVEVQLDPDQVIDPGNEIGLVLEGSFDAGATWGPLVSTRWFGGALDRAGNPRQPRIGYASSAHPDRIRLVIDMPRMQQISADVVEAASPDDPRAARA